MHMSNWRGLLLVVVVIGGLVMAAQAQSPGTYVQAQADRGQAAYSESCVGCHLEDLGGGFGPALTGSSFENVWAARAASELFNQVRNTMPPGGEAVARRLNLSRHRRLHTAGQRPRGRGRDAVRRFSAGGWRRSGGGGWG